MNSLLDKVIKIFLSDWKRPIFALAFLVFFPFPDFKEGLIWQPISNSVHLALGFFIYYFSDYFLTKKYSENKNYNFVIFIFSLGIAGLIEILQPFFGRGLSMEDVILSFWGTLTASLLKIGSRQSLIISVTLGLVFAIVPLLNGIYYARLKWAQFPVLVKLGSDLNEIIKPVLDAKVRINNDNCAIKFKTNGEYSGIEIPLSSQDWTNFEILNIRIINLFDEGRTIGVRIDDNKNCENFEDRFNQNFLIPVGPSTIKVPVLEVKNTVSPKDFRIDEVKRIVIFDTSDEEAEYCIEGVELK